MAQAGPWSVRGLDPDLRAAAAHAAAEAGVSLADWMNTVIAETCDETQRADGASLPPVAPSSPSRPRAPTADPLDVVAQRIARMGERGRAAAPRVTAPDTDMTRVARIIDNAVTALDESRRRRDEKTASALDAMAGLIERSGQDVHSRFETSLRQQEEKAAAGFEQVAKLVERSARETETRTARALESVTAVIEKTVESSRNGQRRDLFAESPALKETLGKIVTRIESLDQRLESDPMPNPVREMIGRLESRLDLLSAVPSPGPAVEASLKELDNRLRDISRKLEGQASPSVGTARDEIGRIEGKLATILETLRSSRPRDPAPRSSAPPRPERRAIPPRRVANGGFEADASERDLLLEDAIADITSRQHDLDGGNQPAARVVQSPPAAPARQNLAPALDDIREQLAQLAGALERLAPQDTVLAIEQSVRELSSRLDEGREAGMRGTDLRPIEGLLADLHDAVRTLRDPGGLDLLRRDLQVMAERMAAAPQGGTDATLLRAMHDQMRDLREMVSKAREPVALDDLDSRIALLADRIDQAAGRPADRIAAADLSSAIEDVRATLRQALPTGILARIERKLGDFGALEQRLGDLSSKIDNIAGRDDLDRIAARLERMQASLHASLTDERAAPSPGPAADFSGIESRIDKLAARLEMRPAAGPDFAAIETTLRDLAGRIVPAQHSLDDAGLGVLETQIGQIREQLELNNGGLAAVGNLGRSINDLFVQLEDVRKGAAEAAERAAISAVREGALADSYAADSLSRDLAELRNAQGENDRRTQTTLAAVHETLGRMVQRLEQIERGAPYRESDPRPPASARSAAAKPEQTGTDAITARVAKAAADVSVSRADRAAPVDMPLEPGSGRPAAAVGANAGAPPEGKAALFAAARRAAQTAAHQSAEALKVQKAGVAAAPAVAGASRKEMARAFVNAKKTPILIGLVAAFIGIVALNLALGSKRQAGPTSDAVAEAKTAAPATSSPPPADAQPMPEAAPAPKREKVSSVPATDPVTVGSIDPAPRRETAPGAGEKVASLTAAPLPPPSTPSAPAPSQGSGSDLGALAALAMPIGSDRLRVSALSGDTGALYEIAQRYADGRGVTRDPAAAAKFFEAAAKLGSAPAQYRLAALYREGRGVPNDKTAAMMWFRKAADAGNARAMHNLGVILAEGYNGQPDYAAAAEWFGRASDLNIRDSQYNLAILYARGLGVGQDLGAAYKWFTGAANQGDEDARRKRDEVAGRIPTETLAQVKAAADAWKPLAADPRANEVATPVGGWDGAAKVMPKAKPAKSV